MGNLEPGIQEKSSEIKASEEKAQTEVHRAMSRANESSQ